MELPSNKELPGLTESASQAIMHLGSSGMRTIADAITAGKSCDCNGTQAVSGHTVQPEPSRGTTFSSLNKCHRTDRDLLFFHLLTKKRETGP